MHWQNASLHKDTLEINIEHYMKNFWTWKGHRWLNPSFRRPKHIKERNLCGNNVASLKIPIRNHTLKLIRVHLVMTGGLWHQSIKVTAKITPFHSWRALRVMSVSSFWWVLRASVLPSFIPLPTRSVLTEAPQERERNKIWHISPLSQSFQSCPLLPQTMIQIQIFLFRFSSLLCLSSPRSSQLLRRSERRAFHEAAWVGACICFSVGACIISHFTALYHDILCLASVSFFVFSWTADKY